MERTVTRVAAVLFFQYMFLSAGLLLKVKHVCTTGGFILYSQMPAGRGPLNNNDKTRGRAVGYFFPDGNPVPP